MQNGQSFSFLGVQIICRMGIIGDDHLIVFPAFGCSNDIFYRCLALLVAQCSGDEFGKLLKTIWEELTAAGEAAEGEYPMEVDFTGFCTGICVLSNVVMAKAFVPEARVCVIENACACVTPQTHQTAIAAMGPIQVDVI